MKNGQWISKIIFIWVGCSLGGCASSNEKPALPRYETFVGRLAPRAAIYRAKVPVHWQRVDPDENEIEDTTVPLCTFFIADKIRLTVHNFYYQTLDQRIPPIRQIDRWQTQLQQNEPEAFLVIPESRGGFMGYQMRAIGELNLITAVEGDSSFNQQRCQLIAWSMQLAAPLWSMISQEERSADYTIKAVGPVELMAQFQHEIFDFAGSFELIEAVAYDL